MWTTSKTNTSRRCITYTTRIPAAHLVTLRAQTARDDAVLPSVTGVWPSADFQEREAWDLMGIRFQGHPNLKRILTWEGFAGHPMRKDWQEPFFEEDTKALRQPLARCGHVTRNEMKNAVRHECAVSSWACSLEGWDEDPEEALYASMSTAESGSGIGTHRIRTDQLVVSLGPQHPSTHGVFRMVVTLDGETITKLEPVMGYLHRNHEQIGERNTYSDEHALHRPA